MLTEIAQQGAKIMGRRKRPWPSKWISENAWISSEVAGTSQDIRADIWHFPCNVGIADMAAEAKRGILVKKAAQIGVSQLFQWLVAYEIAHDGGPIGYSMAKDDTVRKHSVERIEPLIKHIQDVNDLYLHGGKADHQKVQSRRFINATLELFGSGSENNFKSNPYRAAFADEWELMPTFTGGSSAVDLLMGRQGSFGFPKLYGFSTPDRRNQGITLYTELYSDRRVFFIRCPHCQQTIDLDFWRDVYFDYDSGDPVASSARLLCCNCYEQITDGQRAHAIRKAAQAACPWYTAEPYDEEVGWQSTLSPEEALDAEFAGIEKYSKLYSPHVWLSTLARQYVASRRSETKKKTFCNDDLGESYNIYAQVLTEEDIKAKKASGEVGHVPTDTLFLTCGIDVQGGGNVSTQLIFYFDISAWVPTTGGVMKKTLEINRLQADKSNRYKLAVNYFFSYKATDDNGNPYRISTLVIDAGWRTADVYAVTHDLNGGGTVEWAVPMIFSSRQSTAERQKQVARDSESKLNSGASYQWVNQDPESGGNNSRHVVLADRDYVVDRAMNRFGDQGLVELPPSTSEEVIQHYLANEQQEKYDRHGNFHGLTWVRKSTRGGWKEPDDWMLAGAYCEMAAVFRGLDEQEGRALEVAQQQAQEVAQQRRRLANRDTRRQQRIQHNRQRRRRR